MFYRPGIDPHGLNRDPFKACVVPRPIAWVSTRSPTGERNLAPFSFFNAFSWAPPVVALGMPARGSRLEKDTVVNIELTGSFAVSMPRVEDAGAVNATSERVAPEADEFEVAGVPAIECRLIPVDRVATSPICLECRYLQTIKLPSAREGEDNALILGEVLGIHIDDGVIREGRIDYARSRPLMRLGYRDWAGIGETFALTPP